MTLEEIPAIQSAALADVAAAKTPADVENVRIKYVGRNGSLTALMKGLRDVPPADKPAFGQALNALRAAFTEALEARKAAVADEDGAYRDALLLEFGERGYKSYSAYSLFEGKGTGDDFAWSEPAPAGELESLL